MTATLKPLAQDIMTRHPVTVSPSATIRELARVFEENGISGAPVVDRQGTLVGVVSKTDLIRRCSEGTDDIPPAYLFEVLSAKSGELRCGHAGVVPEPLICVDDFMTVDPVTVSPTTPAPAIARLMHEKRIHRVIVVDERNYPLGVITSLDLLGLFPR